MSQLCVTNDLTTRFEIVYFATKLYISHKTLIAHAGVLQQGGGLGEIALYCKLCSELDGLGPFSR
jgi:hypothetical protein